MTAHRLTTTPKASYSVECRYGRNATEYVIRRETPEQAAVEARRLFAAELDLTAGQARWIRVAY